MQLKMFQVDAFTDKLFSGNPAGIVPLETWLPDDTMQAIAMENNVAETAFFVPSGDGYALRWFTPETEVDLCGHATLASAHVLFEQLGHKGARIDFKTRKAGTLTVTRDGAKLALDFPARPAKPVAMSPAVATALGKPPRELLKARDYLAVYDNAADVVGLAPDFAAVAKLDAFAVIVTAPGRDGVDFVSRFFAPAKGVPEDPVTGSAHCTLVPFWAERLGKTTLEARQVSRRGGALTCKLSGERVIMSGKAVLFMSGTITV